MYSECPLHFLEKYKLASQFIRKKKRISIGLIIVIEI